MEETFNPERTTGVPMDIKFGLERRNTEQQRCGGTRSGGSGGSGGGRGLRSRRREVRRGEDPGWSCKR